jgi:hypothetical protein
MPRPGAPIRSPGFYAGLASRYTNAFFQPGLFLS